MNVQMKKASAFKRYGIPEKVIQTSAKQRIARVADTTIAFYASSSQTFPSPGDHFTLNFDTIITNLGNGYHPHFGTFIAIRSGYYVFTWSFRIQHDAHISTELVVNDTPKSSIYYDATDKVGGNAGGTVVVHVNQGDEVFIRTTNTNYNLGDILSDNRGRTYFGGWLLS